MHKLIQKCREFALGIGNKSVEMADLTADAFQKRYIFTQAYGAAHTAEGYWLLRNAGQNHDCQVLARNLLERIFNVRVAFNSKEDSVGLICSEIADRKKRIQKFPIPAGAEAQRDQMVAEQDLELANMGALIGITKAPSWTVFDRADGIGLSDLYRSLYWHLSRYTHAGYDTGRPDEYKKHVPAADFIALVAPIDTALHLHRIDTGCAGCDLEAEYVQLMEVCGKATVGTP